MHRTQEATDEGFEAGRRGEPLEANPHAGTHLAEYWAKAHAIGAAQRASVIVWPILRRRQARQAA